MRQGEIWTAAERGAYSGKPRPVVIVQADAFDAIDSVTVVLFTSENHHGILPRLMVVPDVGNGLVAKSHLMVDKITTTQRTSLDKRIGRLSDSDMDRLETAILVFLGMGRRGT